MWKQSVCTRLQVFDAKGPSALLLRNFRASRCVNTTIPSTTTLRSRSATRKGNAKIKNIEKDKLQRERDYSVFSSNPMSVGERVAFNSRQSERRISRFTSFDVHQEIVKLGHLCDKPELTEEEQHEIIRILDRLKPIMIMKRNQGELREGGSSNSESQERLYL